MTAANRRVAIVGCGAIARAHAAAIAELAGLELVGVVDSHAAARSVAEEEFGVPGFDTVDGLLAATEVDAACVCTPPATHRALAEALLLGGADVLCEKPLAVTAADGEAMMATAERRGRRLAVSDKFRHVADLEEAGRRVRDGDIGAPLTFSVSFCAPVDVSGRWPSNPALSGGGVIMDNGPHGFDVLSHVLDAPITEVSGSLNAPRLAPPVEDTASIVFRTEAGSTGRIELSWVYFTKDLDYLVVQGTEGTIRVAWTGGQVRRHGEREWKAFGTGYDKVAAFRGVWTSFVTPDPDVKRPPNPLTALGLIERVYSAAAQSDHP